jgi:hypothetical protein
LRGIQRPLTQFEKLVFWEVLGELLDTEVKPLL